MYLCIFVLALMLKDIAHYAPFVLRSFRIKNNVLGKKNLTYKPHSPYFSGNRHAISHHVISTYARAHACAESRYVQTSS